MRLPRGIRGAPLHQFFAQWQARSPSRTGVTRGTRVLPNRRPPSHGQNGVEGISDIEGKATRVGASERGQRTSFNRAKRMSDPPSPRLRRAGIEGKGRRGDRTSVGSDRVSNANVGAASLCESSRAELNGLRVSSFSVESKEVSGQNVRTLLEFYRRLSSVAHLMVTAEVPFLRGTRRPF